ncbi:hypothetical protein D3C78_1459520 [compost metagenome]
MHAPLFSLAQIIVVPEDRLGIQHGHHSAQLAKPDLHLHLQKEILMPRLARMRNQCQQAG